LIGGRASKRGPKAKRAHPHHLHARIALPLAIDDARRFESAPGSARNRRDGWCSLPKQLVPKARREDERFERPPLKPLGEIGKTGASAGAPPPARPR
jgi:hypothetical protein